MNCVRRLLVNSPLKTLVKGYTFSFNNTNIRSLYSPAALGIDNYINTRERTLQQFASTEEKFKAKMAEFSEEGSKHMIFTEDLKAMVHLVEDKDDDLNILKAMLKKFNKQNKELRFGSFVFGPVLMRMYYFLRKPKEALDAFKDEDLSGIFDQLISYQILMDLLLETEHYQEVLEVFQIVKDKQLQPNRYPKNVVNLFFAACYKLNTPESFKLATETWQELKLAGHIFMRRAVTFAALLALKQNAPHVALEMLSNEKQQNYITVRNLKARALSDLGRLDDVIPILRSVLGSDDPDGRRQTFTEDTMNGIRAAMERCSDKETVVEFQRIEKQLITHRLIVPETLDSIVSQEIQVSSYNREGSQRSQFLAGSYNRSGTSGINRYRARPGLSEMI